MNTFKGLLLAIRHRAASNLRLVALTFAIALAGSGCLQVKCYVDPQFRSADYLSIKAPANPTPVVVTAIFQTNGKPKKQLHTVVRKQITKVLAATRVFTEATSTRTNEAGRLDVTVNNVGDIGSAVGKGFGTGLTFGLAGSAVVDGYVMTATYSPPAGASVTKTYKHALHSTVGLHSAPKGMEPVPMADAFDQVVEDMLLNFLRDLQKESIL